MMVNSFEELQIWQKAIGIGVKIYNLADQSPFKNDYKSKDQLIGSAVSISNNIAEGLNTIAKFSLSNSWVMQKAQREN